ncbi:MAG: DUF2293 domain-containing protein [Gemmataceae bacterium]|nr:DUF2293 domain-containing protein [Gemmataceae bacterium]
MIRQRFSGCPADEVRRIAEHACEVGSGRVGRSSTAEDPVRAAVVAHIRHEHTNYDELLWENTEDWMNREYREYLRTAARSKVREQIDVILRRWESTTIVEDTPQSCR